MTRRTAIFDLDGVVLSGDPVRRTADGGADPADTWPQYAQAISAYRDRIDPTMAGTVPGTSAVVAELARAGVRLLGLINWSADTFPLAHRRFGILKRLEAIVVSGRENLAGPDPRLYRLLLDRYAVEVSCSVFVDDNADNCESAAALGITALHFTDPASLRDRLVRLGMLGERRLVSEPLFHVAKRVDWHEAERVGSYPWSSHGVSYEAEGFVHLAFGRQVSGVVERYFGRCEPDELVLLELDPELARPVVEEGTSDAFPHLFAPLTAQMVVRELDVQEATDPPCHTERGSGV